VNLYSAHMDPDDWQQPQQFHPERFLDQSDNVINRHRVIAFSLGTYTSESVLIVDLALGLAAPGGLTSGSAMPV